MNPYLQPEDPTAAAAIRAIAEDLEIFDDWLDRYQFIIELGRKLPPYPAEWQDEAHQVKGCQSQVWLAEHKSNDHRLFFAGASDAAIVTGLVALVLRVYSGRTHTEILATSPKFLQDLGLIAALSTNRGNGVAAMAERIQSIAKA